MGEFIATLNGIREDSDACVFTVFIRDYLIKNKIFFSFDSLASDPDDITADSINEFNGIYMIEMK